MNGGYLIVIWAASLIALAAAVTLPFGTPEGRAWSTAIGFLAVVIVGLAIRLDRQNGRR
ncbi:MAG TPA: hypothetical protein VIN69_03160 [Candidatus Limnocylindria bacterium]